MNLAWVHRNRPLGSLRLEIAKITSGAAWRDYIFGQLTRVADIVSRNKYFDGNSWCKSPEFIPVQIPLEIPHDNVILGSDNFYQLFNAKHRISAALTLHFEFY